MVKTKQPWCPEGNDPKGSTEYSKGQVSKSKRYRVKKKRTKTKGLDFEANTNFKGRCSDPEGYIFDLWPRDL